MNRWMIALGLAAALLLAPSQLDLVGLTPAFAHGGGLDSLGCHHDRKRGGYHCHRGALAGRNFGSKSDALKALRGSSTTAPASPSAKPLKPKGQQ